MQTKTGTAPVDKPTVDHALLRIGCSKGGSTRGKMTNNGDASGDSILIFDSF